MGRWKLDALVIIGDRVERRSCSPYHRASRSWAVPAPSWRKGALTGPMRRPARAQGMAGLWHSQYCFGWGAVSGWK